ncbi:hypothetical protein NDU88_001254 [Pleurodeles waltl]|uniref:Uncharacterized protein n=1 Tax=Pleurodeles waltl TaxID=8319 RepID=A0AAV7M2N3_PLEWA|nr:hypothetical protein NDU88_001254 [Pleurodeles waltl]
MGHVKPEEEDCDDAQEEEKRTRKTPTRREDGKKARPASDNEVARREAKTPDNGRMEGSGAESEESERAWETDFPSEAESTKKDAVTTRHIPGGTWLLQLLGKGASETGDICKKEERRE